MEEKEIMNAISSSSLRSLIKAINDEGIKKEDIVTLTKDGEEYVLIYYVK